MRVGLLVVGAVPLAIGASVGVATWLAVDRCETFDAGGCGTPGGTTCDSYRACPVAALGFGLGVASLGGFLLAVGVSTKSRDEITAEALAQLPPAA